MDKQSNKRRALLSVSDKTAVADFAKALAGIGFEIISTGGTAEALSEAGIEVIPVEKVTGSPEMLGGRVKTLHPSIHGGILARRDNPTDMVQLAARGIEPIDLVVVNLYPFEMTVAREDVTLAEAIEQIDIGGPTLLRAAAKNFRDAIVVCDPSDYPAVLAKLDEEGDLTAIERAWLAAKAFDQTAGYDANICSYLKAVMESKKETGELAEQSDPEELKFPARLSLHLRKVENLRYGENPHQGAAVYREEKINATSLLDAEKLQGKQLSFNNFTDLEAAWQLASEFHGVKFCAIIKHANPCGAALGRTAEEAFEAALAADPVSAFGGIIAFNCKVDAEAAEKIKGLFFECLIAPSYTREALTILRKKKSARVLLCPPREKTTGLDFRRISGGMLAQEYDFDFTLRSKWQVPTMRKPTRAETAAMEFAVRICKHVKSNAIVFSTNRMILGVGAGQMSRVDSALIAATRFNKNDVMGPIVMASDAFFPFRDGLDAGVEAGATAVIQPGGSRRDAEVIKAADEHEVAMVFTGRRHFRH